MRGLRRGALAAVAVSSALALVGCGTSERDDVRAKVDQFVKATAQKDYRTLCTQVLAPSLLQHFTAYGLKCERGLALGFNSVQEPRLSIGSIAIHGKTASVTVLTTASGQEGSLTAIELANTSSGWRITGLGTPEFPKKAAAK
jgi:hypothetical protein